MTLRPELGYTGDRLYYDEGYDVRPRIYRVVHHRGRNHGWTTRMMWDVFEQGVLVVEATSLRLAEEFIAERQIKRRRRK